MFKKFLLSLLISFLFCQCYSNKWTTIPDKKDIPLEDSLILFHWKDNEMAVANGQIIDDHIHGYARPLNFDPSKSNEVHIRLKSSFELIKRTTGKMSIPLNAIEEVKIVEKIHKKSKSTNPIAKGAIIGGVVGGLGMTIALAATPGSGEDFIDGWAGVMVGLVAGSAAIGSLVGAAIGSMAAQDWKADSTAWDDPF